MSTWRSEVFQVLHLTSRGQRELGTAFSVFGGRVLTCKHVLAEHTGLREALDKANGRPFVLPELSLHNSAEYGLLSGIEWVVHNTLDAAAGRFPPGTPRQAEFDVSITDVAPGTRVQCVGFPMANPGTTHTFERKVAAWHAERGLVLDEALAPGLSGGPALAHGKVVGIVYGDVADHNVAFLVPLNAIWRWLEEALPPSPSPVSGAVSELDRVSIAPGISIGDVPSAVIKIFAKRFEDAQSARSHLGEAMVLRKRSNREGFNDDQILVQTIEINWAVPPTYFWTSIFEKSLQRSKRTLVALLLAPNAPNPDFLDAPEREAYSEFMEKLGLTR